MPDRSRALGNLDGLTSLVLYGNDLTGSIPSELGNLSNLESLNLHGNALSGAIPAELGNLDGLKYVYLFNNDLSGDLTAAIAGTMDTLLRVRIADGPRGNQCLTSSTSAVSAFLNAQNPGWDDC